MNTQFVKFQRTFCNCPGIVRKYCPVKQGSNNRREAHMKRTSLLLSVPLCFATVAGAHAETWSIYGGDNGNTRFSKAAQINTKNVSDLKVAWALQLGSLRSQESTPILDGDTLYVTSSFGPKNVFAVNAKTGEVKWRYSPELPKNIDQYACCDVNNRGGPAGWSASAGSSIRPAAQSSRHHPWPSATS